MTTSAKVTPNRHKTVEKEKQNITHISKIMITRDVATQDRSTVYHAFDANKKVEGFHKYNYCDEHLQLSLPYQAYMYDYLRKSDASRRHKRPKYQCQEKSVAKKKIVMEVPQETAAKTVMLNETRTH